MDLSKIFGDKPLTHEEFASACTKSGLKIVDLAEGGYIGKEKHDTEVTDLNTRLTEANTKLTGYDPEWKKKADDAETKAQQKIASIEFDHALSDALKSEKAKNATAVKALLKMDGLKYNDGQIIGLKEQIETIKKENDYLFESDKAEVKVSVPGQAKPQQTDDAGYMDSFYKNNPFYNKS